MNNSLQKSLQIKIITHYIGVLLRKTQINLLFSFCYPEKYISNKFKKSFKQINIHLMLLSISNT